MKVYHIVGAKDYWEKPGSPINFVYQSRLFEEEEFDDFISVYHQLQAEFTKLCFWVEEVKL